MAVSAASAPTVAARADRWFARRRTEDQRRFQKVLIVAAIVSLYPFVDSALGIDRLGTILPMFVFVILAMGLNIVVGYAGLLDIGYVAFFVIGAYGNAFLTSPNSYFVLKGWVPEWLQAFWPAMAVSWILAAISGVIIGAPTLRLRGDYLAIVTLGFGEIVPDFYTNAESITRGPRGIGQIAKPTTIPLWGDNELTFTTLDQRNWFWLILVVGLVSLFMITRLYDSRLGRSWQAVREDEVAAASMGVNLVRTKLWAFALGASFSGFAGSIYAGYVRVVYPDQFQFSVSVIILCMVILGGLGNIYGVIAGSLIIGSFDRILAEELSKPVNWIGEQIGWEAMANHSVTSDRFLIFGLALVLLMLLRPGGLFPQRARAAEMESDSPDITHQEREELADVSGRV
jgi:branched-chain amino acid transport system permease protein